jgi:2-dehydro-3-deoxyphosphooctonate aldolase (KDO 8-P synthase)
MHTCTIGSITLGASDNGSKPPLLIIAGPCVLETPEIHEAIGNTVRDACAAAGLPWIFKGSFDKANRTSLQSPRGPGMADGLAMLREMGEHFGVPVTTDVHDPTQADAVAEVADLLQVPAFLCRQSDLLYACGATGRPVNIKKGQFLSPAEMVHAANKAVEAGAGGLMLTERGTFFGYHRLVNDFIGLGDLMDLGWPVCFDATHSTQLPGGGNGTSAGRPERAALLARAAVAAGVQALFIECHPDPCKAKSDGATVQTLEATAAIIQEAAALHGACSGTIV